MDFLAEGLKRKLNADSPTLDDLELVKFNPPENRTINNVYFVMAFYSEAKLNSACPTVNVL